MAGVKKERGLYLADRIRNSYPNNFCGAIVTGPRGIGKSMYALNVVWEVFFVLLRPMYDRPSDAETEAWKKTLDVCKFTIHDVIDFIEYYARQKEQARCLIWDDAGVHASTMEWWENRSALKRLKSVLDTIRTGVCGIIITTPNEGDLTKIVRSYDDYIVQIAYTDDGHYRNAKGYLKRTLPSGSMRIYPKFKNRFPIMIPDWVWNEYQGRRKQLLLDQLEASRKLTY